jgi:hypothetical protein
MSIILLDTTVVIDYTRAKDPVLQALFGSLNLGVCGVVRAEVLAGWRSAQDRAKLIAILDGVAQVPTPDSIWDAVGDNLAEFGPEWFDGPASRCPDRHVRNGPRHRGLEPRPALPGHAKDPAQTQAFPGAALSC